MNDYVEVRVDMIPCSEDMTDVMAAVLADAGFESFVADADGLTAYIRKDDYLDSMAELVNEMPFHCQAKWTAKVIEGRDWNSEWEKNYFKPIVVGDRVAIHSSFHTDVPACEYDIVIDPKMAFGTGHHSTTCLMIGRLLSVDLLGKKVIDMGTGTGILAILAAMRGADKVAGVEIDEAAYVNAVENVALNGEFDIRMIHGDATALSSIDFKADYFLANINRNVITADLGLYAERLAPEGTIFLSGFYQADVPVIEDAARAHGLRVLDVTEDNNWVSVALTR